VRKLLWGEPTGVGFSVGGSPWAASGACRADGACSFNVRDHFSHSSRGAISFNQATSTELYFDRLSGFPTDFCDWGQIWSAIRAAVGGSFDGYDHIVAFMPGYCKIAQASSPGKNVILRMCPDSDLDDFKTILSHELGHNLGTAVARSRPSGERLIMLYLCLSPIVVGWLSATRAARARYTVLRAHARLRLPAESLMARLRAPLVLRPHQDSGIAALSVAAGTATSRR
jgi:hypothetical protein